MGCDGGEVWEGHGWFNEQKQCINQCVDTNGGRKYYMVCMVERNAELQQVLVI